MSIKNKELEENDLLTIIHAAVRDRGLAGHHIDSLNYFTKDGLKQIITKFFGIDHRFINKRVTTPEDQSIESIHFKLTYPTIEMEPTKILNGDSEELMTPKTARDRGLTYGANIFIGVNCVFTANLRAGGTKVRTVSLENLPLSALPIGVKTDMCALTVMPREALLAGGEDPNDPGGYFIIKGTEWVVTCLENQCFNNLSIYRSDKIENERVRGTIITKAGDAFEHTYQSIFKLLKDDRIVFEITLNKKEVIILPFFALFRIFGVSSDSEIMEYILCNDTYTQDELTIVMRNFLENAFDANYGETEHFKDILDQPSTLLAIAKLKTKELLNENNLNNEDICKHYIEPIIEIFDKRVLQQYGTGVNDRKTKAVIVGRYYRDIIMVHLGLAPITDRDSMKIKRMHAAGITLSKSLKSQFNQVVNLPVKKRLMKVLEAESFSTADLASAIHSIIITEGPKLEIAMCKSISTGDEKIVTGGIEIVNRISSQMLQHKNDMNVISSLNIISAASGGSTSKATERADQMRRVHNTSQGYICPNYSADTGEAVGVNKSFAISAEVTLSTSSIVLEQFIRNNKDEDAILIPIMSISPMETAGLCSVSVNGKYIGFCKNQRVFADTYRAYRRAGKFHMHTSVITDPTSAEVSFWTDYGRLVRPMIIVYNNLADIKEAIKKKRAGDKTVVVPTFKQFIKLTKEHLLDIWAGTLHLRDLVKMGIIEYISAGEQLNCFNAASYSEFKRDMTSIIKQYTHCDIPQALLGLVSLASPLANYSSAVRITMSTNHVKQACNRYNCAWPFRFDNGSYFAYRCEHPLVGTMTNAYVYPNGQNIVLAVAMHGGKNMEDSGDINKGCIDLGLFNGIYLKVETVKPEVDTRIGPIDHSKTINVRSMAIYEHLDENGLIKEGSIVREGTVLVSMFSRLEKPEQGQYYFSDKSHIYHGAEEFIVKRVLLDKDGDMNVFCKILMMSYRHIAVGSKIASRMGNKGIIGCETRSGDMPYTRNGIQPNIIINPHSFPSRMAISQDIEGTLALYAAHFGSFVDATTFKKIDIDEVMLRLKEVTDYGPDGLDGGHQYLYNGQTGEMMPVKIFIVPNSYQRLGKFVENAYYAMHVGPASIATQQPLSGKRHNGGLRLGEMEQSTLLAHGTMRFMNEKFREDSDGRDIFICANCGYRAIVNENDSLYKCKTCGPHARIKRVASSYTANTFMNIADGINMDMKFRLASSAVVQGADHTY